LCIILLIIKIMLKNSTIDFSRSYCRITLWMKIFVVWKSKILNFLSSLLTLLHAGERGRRKPFCGSASTAVFSQGAPQVEMNSLVNNISYFFCIFEQWGLILPCHEHRVANYSWKNNIRTVSQLKYRKNSRKFKSLVSCISSLLSMRTHFTMPWPRSGTLFLKNQDKNCFAIKIQKKNKKINGSKSNLANYVRRLL